MKTLGQIAYEADPQGGQQNWGPWPTAFAVVQEVHENMAEAVKAEVLRQLVAGEIPAPIKLASEPTRAEIVEGIAAKALLREFLRIIAPGCKPGAWEYNVQQAELCEEAGKLLGVAPWK